MAQQRISLIKFRRGKQNQRLVTKFEEGEPVYEVDTKRLFIGVGDNDDANLGIESTGGTLTGNLTFENNTTSNPTNVTEPRAYVGDLMYARNKIWRKVSNGWTDISPKVDGVTISYNDNNVLTVAQQDFTVESGNGIIVTNGTQVAVKIHGTSLSFNNTDNGLQVADNGITYDKINQNAFSSVYFKRGAGSYELNLNPLYFEASASAGIKITGVPAGNKTDSLSIDNVGSVNAIISERYRTQDPSTSGLYADNNNDLAIQSSLTVKGDEINSQIVGLKLGVENTLIATGGSDYDGNICEDDTVAPSGITVTEKSVVVYDAENKANMTTSFHGTLKSAGFIVLNSGTTVTGRPYNKFAIPVFAVPETPDVTGYVASSRRLFGKNLEDTQVSYVNDAGDTVIISTTQKNITLEPASFNIFVNNGGGVIYPKFSVGFPELQYLDLNTVPPSNTECKIKNFIDSNSFNLDDYSDASIPQILDAQYIQIRDELIIGTIQSDDNNYNLYGSAAVILLTGLNFGSYISGTDFSGSNFNQHVKVYINKDIYFNYGNGYELVSYINGTIPGDVVLDDDTNKNFLCAKPSTTTDFTDIKMSSIYIKLTGIKENNEDTIFDDYYKNWSPLAYNDIRYIEITLPGSTEENPKIITLDKSDIRFIK